MLTVHHLNQSRSTRVLWLLEELSMPYQRVDHQRDKTTHLAPASLKKIHPLGKAPVMVDGDVVLCESSAVMEYIIDLDEQKRLRPAQGTAEYYQYLEWSHFAEGSLGLPVITHLFMQRETRNGDQPMDNYIAKEINVDFAYIESTLSQRAYFAGNEFTAADIMMTIMLEIANRSGLLEGRENTLAYLTKIRQRQAYQKALSFG
ncbi:glutathione S-transferase family protein [Zooshikella marina]|uniref:glutathione S-transferase family protein n=1 Tax=Zooshikella ganghwensis TaxID=202772 RepID=UPI001BAFAF21|nr:glutathione S-transferase family protein [Zooshikella ganghwensis]MBU2706019.1 glutathione S-transferase family protein [Zooshikella ganghwensis]